MNKHSKYLDDCGIVRLICRMIDVALIDMNSEKYKSDAIEFLRSEYLRDICDDIHLNLKNYIKAKSGDYNLIFGLSTKIAS